MNDFSDFEAELKQLRPLAPSPELMTRVERALQTTPSFTPAAGVLPRPPKVQLNWFALGFGLAAAAVFLILAWVNFDHSAGTKPSVAASSAPAPSATTAAPRSLVPDGVTRVAYRTTDEGLIFPANSKEPVRRLRSRSRETLHWKDPGSGASLRVSYPTEDVELVPVSLSGQ